MQLGGNGAVRNLAIRTLLHSDAVPGTHTEKYSAVPERAGSNMKRTWATAGAEGSSPPQSLSPSLYHTRGVEKMKFQAQMKEIPLKEEEGRKGRKMKRI